MYLRDALYAIKDCQVESTMAAAFVSADRAHGQLTLTLPMWMASVGAMVPSM